MYLLNVSDNKYIKLYLLLLLMNITFVTCWYNMKSKFDKNTYKIWMSNFLSNVNNFNLVIYTNKDSYELIESIVDKTNSKIKIIIKEYEEFKTWGKQNNWIRNHENNNTLNQNSRWNTDWKLNMLWSEKINFVKCVKDNNIFETEWYGWCDIGYFRGGNNLSPQEIRNWPNKNKMNELNKEKIYYGLPGSRNQLNELSRIILSKNANNMPINPIPVQQISIAGGFFISHCKNIDWWHKTYYNRLDDYFKYQYLIKDDQIIIIDCIINNLKNFNLIEEKVPSKDRWFVFQSYLL